MVLEEQLGGEDRCRHLCHLVHAARESQLGKYAAHVLCGSPETDEGPEAEHVLAGSTWRVVENEVVLDVRRNDGVLMI